MITFHWYGAMYVAAFWLGWWLLPVLARVRGIILSREVAMIIVAWVAAGVLIGGRLGYVLLYEPLYFLSHPLDIIAIWQGGMAFHGGLIGAILALMVVARRQGISFWSLTDISTVPVAIGLMLGRIGNFINGELYVGNFALVAAGKDAVIAGVCAWLLFGKRSLPAGVVSGIFLMMYACLRFLTEYVRVDEWGYVAGLTRGQVYTIPIFLLGMYMYLTKIKNT